MRKAIFALIIFFGLFAAYFIFVYFSWDILRHFFPENSYEQVRRLFGELAKSKEKLPAVDMQTSSPKVMVIVIDALSYNILELGFKHELLPNLKRIFASSCIGVLQSSIPMLTPRLLTSMATGVAPEMHGVLDFNYEQNGVLGTGGERKFHAFWHILSERGYKVAVVGWPFTWPAEKVNGYFLSAPGLSSLNFEIYKCCYNTSAQELIFHPTTFELAEAIARSISEAERAKLPALKDLSALKFAKFLPLRLNPFYTWNSDFKEEMLLKIVRRDKFFLEMAKHILSTDSNIDVFALYLESSDAVSHFYLHTPEVVLSIYSWFDEELGEILKLVKGSPAMIVVSDHGVKASSRSLKRAYEGTVKGADWPEIGAHDEIGAFAIRTSYCSKNQQMISAIPEELAPFILSIFDIQPSTEMKNLGLAEWYLGRDIASGNYSSKREPIEIPVIEIMKNPRLLDDYKDQLKALGYL